jgi:DNA end-binding protein Ku
MALVERKMKAGKTTKLEALDAPAEQQRSAEVLDLSDLLRRSLGGRAKSRGGKSRGARESSDLSGDAANDDEASKPTKTRGARGA